GTQMGKQPNMDCTRYTLDGKHCKHDTVTQRRAAISLLHKIGAELRCFCDCSTGKQTGSSYSTANKIKRQWIFEQKSSNPLPFVLCKSLKNRKLKNAMLCQIHQKEHFQKESRS
ncbi:MAG: hypothetical protein RR612_08455, partial [Oscillospiraceae bacterium]